MNKESTGNSTNFSINSFFDNEKNPYFEKYITLIKSWIDNSISDKLDIISKTPENIRIKYLKDDITKLTKIDQGDWIDVYAAEDVIIPEGEHALIPLGFCMELPKGYEAYLAPRSSTFKNWGIIVANSIGIIDESYNGDGDQWLLSAYCLKGKETIRINDEDVKATIIHKNDKIAQFRIMKKMPMINFLEVDNLGNEDRNGLGSTGKK